MCTCKWIMSREKNRETPRRHDEYVSAPSGDRVGVPRCCVHVALVPCEHRGASTWI